MLEQRRQRRHRRAADADEMNCASVSHDRFAAALRSRSGGCAAVPIDARVDAKRQGPGRPGSVTGGKAEQHRAGKVSGQTIRSARHGCARSPPGSSQRGQLAEDERRWPARVFRPARAASACGRCDTAAPPTSSMNSTQPCGGSQAHGVPSEAVSCVSVPPTSTPRASPGLKHLEARRRQLAHRHGLAERAKEGRAVVAGLAGGEPPLDHRPVKARRARAAGAATAAP